MPVRVIVPVKRLGDSKTRLVSILSPEQRAKFSYLSLTDVLHALMSSPTVESITIISSDKSIATLSELTEVDFILTDLDRGHSHDVAKAIEHVRFKGETIAVISADVPQITCADVERLAANHRDGLSLCRASVDGGTNALMFDSKIQIPFLFGIDSYNRFKSTAEAQGIPVHTVPIPAFTRDIDRPEDMIWLREQKTGGEAWAFVRRVLNDSVQSHRASCCPRTGRR